MPGLDLVVQGMEIAYVGGLDEGERIAGLRIISAPPGPAPGLGRDEDGQEVGHEQGAGFLMTLYPGEAVL